MTKSNIKILLVLATIAILGATYMYVFKPNMEDKEAIETEISSLETKLADLKAKDAHRDEYLAEIETNKAYFNEVVNYFPATLDQEISVMFIKGVEKDKGNLQFDVNSVGLGKPGLFYTLTGTSDNEAGYQGKRKVSWVLRLYFSFSLSFGFIRKARLAERANS